MVWEVNGASNISKSVLHCLLDKESNLILIIQARIAQLVAYWLGTGEVPGSNLGKGENFSVKISNWIVRI